jgi:hypothetical protein
MEQTTTPATADAAQIVYVVKKSNGLGTGALVLGILAIVFAWIPFLNVVSIPLALIAIGLGIGGIVKARKVQTGMVKTVIGIVLALGSFATFAVVNSAAVSAVDEAVTAVNEAMNVADKVDVTLGNAATDDFGTTTLPVTITNVSQETVSVWVSISATSPDGSEQYGTADAIVNDLTAGQKANEEALFLDGIPSDAVFTITDVM